jgi:glycogen debranching enzyme
MGDYVIKMNLEVYNKKNPEDNIGVIYDKDMSEEDAESIDAVEKIFVNLNRQVLKDGISEHLENISKKCQKYQEENGGII